MRDHHPTHGASAVDARRARFEQVATHVWAPLQRYVRRRAAPHDVDDVVAETLTVLWRRLDDVPADAELPWCYQAARRCLANHRRSARRRGALTDRLRLRRPPAATSGPDSVSEPGDAALHEAMSKLSADDRELVRLWAWEELEPREIAMALGVSANVVSARLSRARRRLVGLLGEDSRSIGHDRTDAGQEPAVVTNEQQP